jgi:negative regulator of flagellin synthesis FlgM
MAIESITGRTLVQPTTKTAQKAEIDIGNKATTRQAERNDSIAITVTAQGLKKAFEPSASGTIVDVERVAAVKKAIAEGSYQINAERIAEKMIQYEKLMPQNEKT